MAAKLKFKKGDKVIVLVGKDKGKRSEILRMIPASQKAIVQGVNVATGSSLHNKQQAAHTRYKR